MISFPRVKERGNTPTADHDKVAPKLNKIHAAITSCSLNIFVARWLINDSEKLTPLIFITKFTWAKHVHRMLASLLHISAYNRCQHQAVLSLGITALFKRSAIQCDSKDNPNKIQLKHIHFYNTHFKTQEMFSRVPTDCGWRLCSSH